MKNTKKPKILPNLQSIRKCKWYNVTKTETGDTVIFRKQQKCGCKLGCDKLFIIRELSDKIHLEILSDVYPETLIKECDGFDVIYYNKQLYIKGYCIESQTVSTFLVSETGEEIDEYDIA